MSLEPAPGSSRRQLAYIGDALTTKSASLFALASANGDIDSDVNPGYGVYFHDTRFLDRWTLRLDGEPLALLLSTAEGARSICQLTNPDIQLRGPDTLGKNRIGVRRERRLGTDVVESIVVENFGPTPLHASLEFEFAARFEDMFVIRGATSGKRGRLHPPSWDGECLRFEYDGADGRQRTTTLKFSPAPTSQTRASATIELDLEAGARSDVRVTAELRDAGPGDLEPRPIEDGGELLRGMSVRTDNLLFDRALNSSLDDLRMLMTRQKRDIYFAAGVPWFVALFGRDSLITGLQALAFDPTIAATTLELLAKYQATEIDHYRDSQPGKILHELRVGEMAQLGEVPQTPYYGSVDATPLFVVLMAEYLRWTGDLRRWRRLRRHVESALEWIDRYADSDGDGFVDYQTRSSRGSLNQGWKDSANSIRNRDGSPAEPPLALVEVQGLVYRAKLGAAWLFEQDGEEERPRRLESEAAGLRSRFSNAYWMPSQKYLAVALQKGGRQAESITSNPGQALWTGIVEQKHAHAVARVLMSEPMFSGWGVRTLARGEPSYNPIDYQVGSIWPHDNSLIAAGLKLYGHHEESLRIFSSIFEASVYFSQLRLPELFAGFARDEFPAPVRYPIACNPQAWAAGALPYLLHTALGLEPNAPAHILEIRRPRLPSWLREVAVSGLQVGQSRIDLEYRRDASTTFVAVKRRVGDVEVRISE